MQALGSSGWLAYVSSLYSQCKQLSISQDHSVFCKTVAAEQNYILTAKPFSVSISNLDLRYHT